MDSSFYVIKTNVKCLYKLRYRLPRFLVTHELKGLPRQKVLQKLNRNDCRLFEPNRIIDPLLEEMDESIGIGESDLRKFFRDVPFRISSKYKYPLRIFSFASDWNTNRPYLMDHLSEIEDLFDDSDGRSDDEWEIILYTSLEQLFEIKVECSKEDIKTLINDLEESITLLFPSECLNTKIEKFSIKSSRERILGKRERARLVNKFEADATSLGIKKRAKMGTEEKAEQMYIKASDYLELD